MYKFYKIQGKEMQTNIPEPPKTPLGVLTDTIDTLLTL